MRFFAEFPLPPALDNSMRGAVRRTATSVLLAGMLLIASAAWMDAQQPLSLADADLRGATIFEQSGVTGMVLVVVRNSEVMMKELWGNISRERRQTECELADSTLLHIESPCGRPADGA